MTNDTLKGIIIYEKPDAEKNEFFIRKLTEELSDLGIYLELKFISEVDGSETTDFVVNRSRDYKLSQLYEQRNIRVFNNSIITELGNDKSKAQQYFESKVSMMPLTDGYPAVVKSVDGHGGSEVFLVKSEAEEKEALANVTHSSNKHFIRQEVAKDLGVDKRVYIIGNKIVAAVLRTSDDFRSNFSLGGQAKLSEVTDQEQKMIGSLLDGIYADYVGLDLIYNMGQPVFNEMEDAVGARMLYNSSSVDIIKMFAEHIAKTMH